MDNKKWVNVLFSVSLILLMFYFVQNVWAPDVTDPALGGEPVNDTWFNNITGSSMHAALNRTFNCSIGGSLDNANVSLLFLSNATLELIVDKTNNSANLELVNSSNTTRSEMGYDVNLSAFTEGKHFWACAGLAIMNGENSTSLGSFVGNSTLDLVLAGKLGNISTNRTFYIDSHAPHNISLVSPVNSIVLTDNNTIFFNFSVTDAVDNSLNCNLTVDNIVVNSTIVASNLTDGNLTAGSYTDDWVSMATTNFDVGFHTWNVTCMDSASNTNSSGGVVIGGTSIGIYGANFSITDTKVPSTPGAPTFSVASVAAGGKVTITCPATSDTTTSNPTEKVSVKGPLVADEYSEVGNSPFEFTTSEAGTYTAKCRATDTTGNNGAFGITATFKATMGGASATTSAGGSGSSAITGTVLRGATVEIGELAEGQQGRGVYERGTVTFSVAGSSHSAQVTNVDITNQQVTLTISSDPIELTIGVGETKQVDVDSDGTNDLQVELLAIDAFGKAELIFKSLLTEEGEPIPETEPEGETTTTPTDQKGGMSAWLIVLIIIVVIVAIIFFRARRQRAE